MGMGRVLSLLGWLLLLRVLGRMRNAARRHRRGLVWVSLLQLLCRERGAEARPGRVRLAQMTPLAARAHRLSLL